MRPGRRVADSADPAFVVPFVRGFLTSAQSSQDMESPSTCPNAPSPWRPPEP
jgi:hypothetical protein